MGILLKLRLGQYLHSVIPVLSGNVSNWRSYLGNTYDQWTGKDTPVYLATVTQDIKQVRSVKSFLTIEVGDDSRWEGYRNGALVPGEKYQ